MPSHYLQIKYAQLQLGWMCGIYVCTGDILRAARAGRKRKEWGEESTVHRERRKHYGLDCLSRLGAQ
jgi:hypothetical protein